MKSRLLLILPALALAAGCSKSPETPADAAAALPAMHVTLATVEAVEAPALIEVTGSVRPSQRAQLAAKVMGSVAELPVTLGQRVAAGDLLVRLSAAEIAARVTQACAQLNVARRDLARERDLLAQGASTPDMVSGLEDRHALLEAMVREAETMLGYTEIRAPFAGVIARRHVHAGDLAAPGHPLLELEGTDNFEIEAGVPDSLAPRLAVGDSLLVEAPHEFHATLVELGPSSDARVRTVTIKLSVPATAAVRSGQFVRVHVPSGSARTLLVPAAAVTTVGQMERVFVVENGRAVLRLVKSGARHGGRIEVLSGLEAGETIVAQPVAGLREGQPIEPRS